MHQYINVVYICTRVWLYTLPIVILMSNRYDCIVHVNNRYSHEESVWLYCIVLYNTNVSYCIVQYECQHSLYSWGIGKGRGRRRRCIVHMCHDVYVVHYVYLRWCIAYMSILCMWCIVYMCGAICICAIMYMWCIMCMCHCVYLVHYVYVRWCIVYMCHYVYVAILNMCSGALCTCAIMYMWCTMYTCHHVYVVHAVCWHVFAQYTNPCICRSADR